VRRSDGPSRAWPTAIIVALVDESAARRRANAHVDRFNAAQASGDWSAFAHVFAHDARMSFAGVPVGPFEGRAAIADAYRSSPPTDTMRVIDATEHEDSDSIRFAWTRGGTGTMTIRWVGDLVGDLLVTFD
jgi:steroid delta-isomerase